MVSVRPGDCGNCDIGGLGSLGRWVYSLIGLLLSISIALGGMPVHEGTLSQYAEGVMGPTVAARQEWGQLPEDLSMYDGFVAHWDCDKIGDEALLSIDGGEWLRVLIGDCSGHVSTTRWMRANNVIFEISGELAAAHGVVCLCPVDGRVIWLE